MQDSNTRRPCMPVQPQENAAYYAHYTKANVPYNTADSTILRPDIIPDKAKTAGICIALTKYNHNCTVQCKKSRKWNLKTAWWSSQTSKLNLRHSEPHDMTKNCINSTGSSKGHNNGTDYALPTAQTIKHPHIHTTGRNAHSLMELLWWQERQCHKY